MMQLRRALPPFGRARAFAITAVLALALILGICATTLDLLWSFYVRPVPYREPDRGIPPPHVSLAQPGDAGVRAGDVGTARAVRITDVLKHE